MRYRDSGKIDIELELYKTKKRNNVAKHKDKNDGNASIVKEKEGESTLKSAL